MAKHSNSRASTIVIKFNRPTRCALPVGIPGQHFLLPGENNVDADVWELAKRNVTIQKYMSLGLIEDKGEGKARPIADRIDKVPDTKARMWIDAEKDMAQLKRWFDHETRDAVRDLISARMDQLARTSAPTLPQEQHAE